MIVIAHRGASAYAPEHTFAAWDLADQMGADFLEQDLQMTKDGVLVVLHDETLDRTARCGGVACRGPVIEHTLAELRECDVGSWHGPAFADQRIATLEEVLQRYPSANFYIETKNPEAAPGMEEALLSLLDRYGLIGPAHREWRVLIQSFSEASLLKLHAADAALPLIRLIDKGAAGDLAGLEAIAEYAVGIGPDESDVTAALVTAAHEQCLHVHPYTVDDVANLRRLMTLGVDGIFTNVPDVLIGLLPGSRPPDGTAVRAAAQAHARCRGGRGHGS
jgi:glycerophosphoryl diester phosphodiesterase